MSDLFASVFGQSLASLKVKNLDSASLHEIISEFAPLLTGEVIPIAKKALIEVDSDIDTDIKPQIINPEEQVNERDCVNPLKDSPEVLRNVEGSSVNGSSIDETDSCGPVDHDSVKSEELYTSLTEEYIPMTDGDMSHKENQPDMDRKRKIDCIDIKGEPEDMTVYNSKARSYKTTVSDDGALDLSFHSSRENMTPLTHQSLAIKVEPSLEHSSSHSIQNHSSMPFQDMKPKLNIDSIHIPVNKKPKREHDVQNNAENLSLNELSFPKMHPSTIDHINFLKNGLAKGMNGLDNFLLATNMNAIKLGAQVPQKVEMEKVKTGLINAAKAQLRGPSPRYKIYSCEICKQVFDTKYHVNRHMMQSHEGVDPFVCEVCSKVFAQKCDLTRHMNIHLNVKKHFCKVCNKAFKRADYLAKHEKEFCSVFRPHKCEKCGRCYATEEELMEHKETHEIRLAFKCDKCDDSFQEEPDFLEHKTQHKDDKPQDCPLCSQTFPDFKDFVNHYKEHAGQRPYTCALCDKTFTRNHNLMTHLWIHNKTKSHFCPHCGKTFTYYSNLQVHLRVHTGERPYICGECNKSFLTSSDLRRHHRTHSGDKPYICKTCKMAFTRKERLIQHREKEHH